MGRLYKSLSSQISFKLRECSILRAGRVEAASALSERICKEITWRCKKRLGNIDGKTDAKEMWAAMRQLTGRQQKAAIVDGITAESLNDHYAAVSTDRNYVIPRRKPSTTSMQSDYVSEWKIFNMLDKLRSTATGLAGLPAWFLRVGAPVFSRPIAMLFNLSIASSTVGYHSNGNKPASGQSLKSQHPSSTSTFALYQSRQSLPELWSAHSCTNVSLSCFPLAAIIIVFF